MPPGLSVSVETRPLIGAGTDGRALPYGKVMRRFAPILLLCYVVAYLDRVNVGYAKLQMLGDLGFGDTIYALGAAIFFWGYVLFEIPSNMIMHKVGAKLWMARIMVTWGLVSVALTFVGPIAHVTGASTTTTFLCLRFLLGVCEAGFFPGVILYANYWMPSHRQSRLLTCFLIGMPLSLMLGSPLSGWLMSRMNGLSALGGWQWMLLIEGVPAIILGFVLYQWLDDGVESARWLTAEEKGFIRQELAAETKTKSHTLGGAVRDLRVWHLALIVFANSTGIYGLSFWMPSLIGRAHVTDPFHIGLLAAIPYAASTLAMALNGWHSSRSGERKLHAAIPALLGGVGLMLSAVYASNLPVALCWLSVGGSGMMALVPVFWTFPGAVLSGTAAAAGIAMINAVGSLAGISGAMITNLVQTATGHLEDGTYVLGGFMILAGILFLLLPRGGQRYVR